MKGSMKVVLLAALAIVVLLVAGALLYKHFIIDQIMDGDGMEDPNAPQMLDGDGTYVDNAALLKVIAGTWSDADGGCLLTLDDECFITLTLDGETVLEAYVSFTYLRPGAPRETELCLEPDSLTHRDGTVFAKVRSFCYMPGASADELVMEIDRGVWQCGCGETAAGAYCPSCGAAKVADTDDGDSSIETIRFRQTERNEKEG